VKVSEKREGNTTSGKDVNDVKKKVTHRVIKYREKERGREKKEKNHPGPRRVSRKKSPVAPSNLGKRGTQKIDNMGREGKCRWESNSFKKGPKKK